MSEQPQFGSRPPAAPLHHRAEFERAKRGWTQEELAEHSGVSRVTYHRLLTNITPPISRTVNRLCGALGIPLAEGLHLAGLDTSLRREHAGGPPRRGAEHQMDDETTTASSRFPVHLNGSGGITLAWDGGEIDMGAEDAADLSAALAQAATKLLAAQNASLDERVRELEDDLRGRELYKLEARDRGE